MKRVLVILILGVSAVASSCRQEGVAGFSSDFSDTSDTASGSHVIPGVNSQGTAIISGLYNARTKLFEYSVTWKNLSDAATVLEIHGPAGIIVNAPLLFSTNINSGGVNGSISDTVTLHGTQQADFFNSNFYFIIRTAPHPDGEIRGQINPTPVV